MKFIVWGKPKAKGRPRLSTYGGFARAYTPQETIEYENLIKLSYLQASETQEPIEYDNPIVMTINAYYPIQKAVSKKKRAEMLNGVIRPCIKVDCDNDTLLLLVEQVGSACHTGNRTCFYRDL